MMFTLKIVGTTQLLLLAVFFGLSDGTTIAWTIAALYCAIMLLTCGYVSLRRMQYAGWWGWFLFAYACVVTPLGAMLYFVLPGARLDLFAATACAVMAERFREQRAEQRQLGWLALPIVSGAIAILLNFGRLLEALNFAMAAAALCATVLFYTNIARRPIYPAEAETHTVPASTLRSARTRSIGRAA